jgi:hypothetical protein
LKYKHHTIFHYIFIIIIVTWFWFDDVIHKKHRRAIPCLAIFNFPTENLLKLKKFFGKIDRIFTSEIFHLIAMHRIQWLKRFGLIITISLRSKIFQEPYKCFFRIFFLNISHNKPHSCNFTYKISAIITGNCVLCFHNKKFTNNQYYKYKHTLPDKIFNNLKIQF